MRKMWKKISLHCWEKLLPTQNDFNIVRADIRDLKFERTSNDTVLVLIATVFGMLLSIFYVSTKYAIDTRIYNSVFTNIAITSGSFAIALPPFKFAKLINNYQRATIYFWISYLSGNCLFERENAKIQSDLRKFYENTRDPVLERLWETDDRSEMIS